MTAREKEGAGVFMMVAGFLLLNVMARYLISVHPHSGQGVGPMYGDYEAQRHWMEITTALPLHAWYANSSDNNLLYWGLDYPPLTAYHSWLCGKIAGKIEPASMQLFSSRGYETTTSKIFMRMSVIVSDLLTYLPAVYMIAKHHSKYQGWSQVKGMLFLSMQPALLLIDHGHFQYNGVSLGLALASIYCIFNSRLVMASILFSLSLNFKQMGLFYSTTFFFYLLGMSIDTRNITGSIIRLAKIGASVIGTFVVCWLPFLTSVELAKQVLHRIFPVARGLYEDKVANFWCSVSPVIKFKNIFSPEKLMLLSVACTLLSLLPTGLSICWKPTRQKFIFSLVAASLGYFLFSFQVHEKSILLPLLPASVLIMSKRFAWISVWLQIVGTFSMYPLLHKDGLDIPYCAAMFVMTCVGLDKFVFEDTNVSASTKRATVLLSLLGMVAIHTINILFTPPIKLPDLFVLLFAIYSFAHFFVAFMYFNYLVIFDPSIQHEFKLNKDKLS